MTFPIIKGGWLAADREITIMLTRKICLMEFLHIISTVFIKKKRLSLSYSLFHLFFELIEAL